MVTDLREVEAAGIIVRDYFLNSGGSSGEAAICRCGGRIVEAPALCQGVGGCRSGVRDHVALLPFLALRSCREVSLLLWSVDIESKFSKVFCVFDTNALLGLVNIALKLALAPADESVLINNTHFDRPQEGRTVV